MGSVVGETKRKDDAANAQNRLFDAAHTIAAIASSEMRSNKVFGAAIAAVKAI